MIWALIRARKKNLTCSRCIISTEGDLLFASGVCDHIITSWFSAGHRLGRVEGDAPLHREQARARSRSGATWRSACAFAPAPWAFPSCRRARCSARTCGKQRPEAKEIDCPFTGEKLLLVPALNPGRRADPRAALRRLRQRADRRPAVHGHRPRHGGQPRDPDDRAHRLQRPDPARARPDEDPVLRRRGGGRGAVSAARRTSATASTSRSSRTSTTTSRMSNKDPVEGCKEYLDDYVYGPKSWTDYLST